MKLLEEIGDAYLHEDLMPCQDRFYVNGPDGACACPLTALALHRGIFKNNDPRLLLKQDDGNPVFDWSRQEFGESWTLGFLDGYDYCQRNIFLTKNMDYAVGYMLGAYLCKIYRSN